MQDKSKDIDIVGIASGLFTRVFEYSPRELDAVEKQFGFSNESFSWVSALPSYEHRKVRGICFSTIEESLIVAAHLSERQRINELFAKRGNDKEGAIYDRLIKDYGILYGTPPKAKLSTFNTHIYVSPKDKEPTIISLRGGASGYLRKSDIKKQSIKRARFLMADAYNISLPALHEVIIYASRLAHQYNTKIVYGLGRHEIIRENRDKLEQYIDTFKPEILNGNQFEFKELLFRDFNSGISNEALCREVKEYIKRKGIDTAVVTFSEKGSCIVRSNALVPIKAYKVPEQKVVDKACAGTAYMGGFLAARCHGKDYKDAGKWGAYAASQTIKQYGLRPDWKKPKTPLFSIHGAYEHERSERSFRNAKLFIWDLDNVLYFRTKEVRESMRSAITKALKELAPGQWTNGEIAELERKGFEGTGQSATRFVEAGVPHESLFTLQHAYASTASLAQGDEIRKQFKTIQATHAIITSCPTAWTERVLGARRLREYFYAAFDNILGCDQELTAKKAYIDKHQGPDAFLAMLERAGATGADAIFIDDRHANLRFASELGIETVWIRHGQRMYSTLPDYIDHAFESTEEFLQEYAWQHK